jgi:anaerobic glycerol-3-phosphate dehydrogenase
MTGPRQYPKLRRAEKVGIVQASLERTETRSHCTERRGDELRRQAESCRQLAASSLMERHKLVWLRLANEWLELARRADEVVISLKGSHSQEAVMR